MLAVDVVVVLRLTAAWCSGSDLASGAGVYRGWTLLRG